MDETSLIEITSRGLSARINPLGAELWSLRDEAGREFMTGADPAFWTGHAPVLFPIVGELNGGNYRLDDARYALSRHGFARRSLFEEVERRAHLVRFRLGDSDATREVYPFAFELELVFRLGGMRLETEAIVRNPGEVPLPFSLGFHPAFAWPLPGGGSKAAHEIAFEADEPAMLRRLDGAGLVAASEPSPLDGRILPLRPELFANDAMIWDRLESAGVEYRGEAGGPALRIDFPDMPYLGIWQKPGASFICIEPWHGLADDAGFDGDFTKKRGVINLPPGQARSFRMDVTVASR